MSITQLENGLTKALATSKIGVPVALRAHVRINAPVDRRDAAVAYVLRLGTIAFAREPNQVMAQTDSTGQEFSAVFNYETGQTLMLTIDPGSETQAELHLLLVGNHGIARLEGAENAMVETADGDQATGSGWMETINECLQSRAPVSRGR